MTTTENNVAAQAGDEPMPCTCPSGDGSLRWPCPQHPPKLDVVVEANRALLHARSQLGIKKYGGTLDTMRHSRRALLQHALEEALDLANYLQADIQAIDREASQVSPRATADVERESCSWVYEEGSEAWASGCGELWSFIDGGPQENRVKFCQGCGKPLSLGGDVWREAIAFARQSITIDAAIATTKPGA